MALTPGYNGIKVEQLYSENLSKELSQNLKLIYSGESRKSGINNWEVYKGFFDADKSIRDGLERISELSSEALISIKNGRFDHLVSLIGEEGAVRENLFPTILTEKMKSFQQELFSELPNSGMKICGAGGGGCFVVTNIHSDITDLLTKFSMRELPIEVNMPIEGS